MSLRNTYKTKRKNVEEQRAVEDLNEIVEYISMKRSRDESESTFISRANLEIEEFLKNEAQAKIDLEDAQRDELGE